MRLRANSSSIASASRSGYFLLEQRHGFHNELAAAHQGQLGGVVGFVHLVIGDTLKILGRADPDSKIWFHNQLHGAEVGGFLLLQKVRRLRLQSGG